MSALAVVQAAGVEFKKKPDDGRMKGLAFVYDPDGYWVEIVKRADDAAFSDEFNLSQTMLRIKDPKKSISFYEVAQHLLITGDSSMPALESHLRADLIVALCGRRASG